MDLLKVLSELSPGAKIFLTLISAPLAMWLTWLKVQKGSISLSKARTERLYELMLREDACSVPSGALTMAVKEAMNVELGGDRIRFALQFDNPLFVLRAFKSTLGDVKMSPDGKTCLDARSKPWLSLQTKKNVYIWILLAAYAVLVVAVLMATLFSKEKHAPWLGYIFFVNFAAIPFLLWRALRIEMARKLIAPRPGEMRRPASSLDNSSTRVADTAAAPDHSSPSFVNAEARETEAEDRGEEDEATAGDVTGVIENAINSVPERNDEPLAAETASDA